mmetsp:Transcript_51032/g.81285  ORF Transcript_51032/g.81285 Transcript_51032/m.81285 type:complete len:216 (+) Transcript_51032:316-963(+)
MSNVFRAGILQFLLLCWWWLVVTITVSSALSSLDHFHCFFVIQYLSQMSSALNMYTVCIWHLIVIRDTLIVVRIVHYTRRRVCFCHLIVLICTLIIVGVIHNIQRAVGTRAQQNHPSLTKLRQLVTDELDSHLLWRLFSNTNLQDRVRRKFFVKMNGSMHIIRVIFLQLIANQITITNATAWASNPQQYSRRDSYQQIRSIRHAISILTRLHLAG